MDWAASSVGVVLREDEASLHRWLCRWALRSWQWWQGDSGEVASGATTGSVAGVKAMEAASFVGAVADSVVWTEAAIAPAAEVLFKGLNGRGALPWWLAGIE